MSDPDKEVQDEITRRSVERQKADDAKGGGSK
jgi:hypothetical protein